MVISKGRVFGDGDDGGDRVVGVPMHKGPSCETVVFTTDRESVGNPVCPLNVHSGVILRETKVWVHISYILQGKKGILEIIREQPIDSIFCFRYGTKIRSHFKNNFGCNISVITV